MSITSTIKNFFFGTGTTEQAVGATAQETPVMTAVIVTTDEGFGLMRRGEIIQTYSRRRDAVRGAERRGLVVA